MNAADEIEWALNAPPPCKQCGCQHDDTLPIPKPAKACGCSIDWPCDGAFTGNTHGVKTYREDACYRSQVPMWVWDPYRIGERRDVLDLLLEYARERKELLAAIDRATTYSNEQQEAAHRLLLSNELGFDVRKEDDPDNN